MKTQLMRPVALLLCMVLLGSAIAGCAPKGPDIVVDNDEVVTRVTTTTTGGESTDTTDSTTPSSGTTTGNSGGNKGTTTTKKGSVTTTTTKKGSVTTTTTKKDSVTTTTTAPKGGPVKAEVKVVNGTPRLFINGTMTTGNQLFVNGDYISLSEDIYTSEIGHASAGGIHMYSTIYNVSYTMNLNSNDTVKYAELRRRLDNILDADPQAMILLRVSCYASPNVFPEGAYVFANGTQSGFVSVSCDAWEQETSKRLQDMIAYIRSVPKYAASVYGYHLDNREWFPDNFTVGPDISAVNTAKFREWLKNKYKSDAALQQAWGSTSYTLANAEVPSDLPVNSSSDRTLLLKDTDQRFIDYNRYWSELTASRIEALAKTIKEATNNESVVIAFYGYYFEQYHALTGHWDFDSLLNSPYLDGFASPTSYFGRTSGGDALTATSGYMTAVDTVTRAGKMWIMESDERTFINHSDRETDTTWAPPLKTIEDILSVHKREMGIAAIHGAAMYPMDLAGTGWYDDSRIWQNFGQLDRALMSYSSAQKSRPTFDVALVIDERASAMVGTAAALSGQSLTQSMLNVYRAGVSFGLVELNDLLNGKADDYKVYIFLNPYALTSTEVTKLSSVLHKDNKTAVYMYSFGNLSAADAKKLTGMDITTTNSTVSHYLKLATQNKITGLKNIDGMTGNPKTTCANYTTLLGTYSDGSAGFALYEGNGYRSIFMGSNKLSIESIRAFARYGGANIFSEGEDVVVANKNMLMISAKTSGSKTIRFDKAVDVYDYFTDTWYLNTKEVTLKGLIKGDVSWLFYGKKSDIEAMKLPKWSEV